GLPVSGIRLALMLLIAIVIAVAMKVVGVLLITSLLIIPPAAAQRHARTPEQMAVGASCLGCVAVLGGLALSWNLDTPAWPSIVVSGAGLFMLSLLVPRRAEATVDAHPRCRSEASTGAVSGRTPRHRKKASAACSTSMPRPSMQRAAPCSAAQRLKTVASLAYIMS